MKKEDIEEIENEESDENIKGVDLTDAMLPFLEPNFMENAMKDLEKEIREKELRINSFDEIYSKEEDKDNETVCMEVKDNIIYIKNAKAGDKIKIEFSPEKSETIFLIGRVSNDSNILKQIQEAISNDDKDEVVDILASSDFIDCSQKKYIQIGFSEDSPLLSEPQIKLFRDDEELLQEDLDYESIKKIRILIGRDYDSFFPRENPKEVFDLHVMHSYDVRYIDFLFTILTVKEDGDLQIDLDDFRLLTGYLSENIVDANLVRQAVYIPQKEKEELFNRLKEDFKEEYEDYKKSCENEEFRHPSYVYDNTLFDFMKYIEEDFRFAEDNFKKYLSQYRCEIKYEGDLDNSGNRAMIDIGYKNEDGKFKRYDISENCY